MPETGLDAALGVFGPGVPATATLFMDRGAAGADQRR